MAETTFNPQNNPTLVASKTIADSSFYEDDIKNPVFPLSYRQDYKGQIKFSVIEEEATNEQEIIDAMSTKQQSLPENGNAFDERGEKLKKNAQEKAEDLKRQVEAKNQGYRKSTVNRSTRDKKPPISLKSATLFLPQGISFADGVNYENTDLGITGQAASVAVSDGISGLLGSMFGGADKETGKLAAQSVVGVFSDTASAGVRAVAKVTPNPNSRALFKSVNMRSFTFTFKLIPVSLQESEMISEIVRFFRTELYPEQILLGQEADDNGAIPLGYKFPNKILIEMSYNNKKIKAQEILPCYLENMQTTYNASSASIHEDGHFQEVDITLNFRETRTLSRKDINNGY